MCLGWRWKEGKGKEERNTLVWLKRKEKERNKKCPDGEMFPNLGHFLISLSEQCHISERENKVMLSNRPRLAPFWSWPHWLAHFSPSHFDFWCSALKRNNKKKCSRHPSLLSITPFCECVLGCKTHLVANTEDFIIASSGEYVTGRGTEGSAHTHTNRTQSTWMEEYLLYSSYPLFNSIHSQPLLGNVCS